jgi:hypothetical protein
MEETASARTTVAVSSGVGVLEGRAWAPTAAAAGSGVGVLVGIDFPLDPVSTEQVSVRTQFLFRKKMSL